jgi:amino acid transporter
MLREKIKKFDVWDISLIKLSVIAFTLFVLTIWPALAAWAYSVSPWYYLILLVVFAIRPVYKVLLK